MDLLRNSPVPLYYQLKEVLRRKIRQDGFCPGDLFLSERELVDTFQISRPTVRQAINELVSDGLLYREKGRGTFIGRPKIQQQFLENLLSFSDEMAEKGLSHSTMLLSNRVVQSYSEPFDPVLASTHETFYRLERLRFVQNNPVVLVTTYIPCSFALGLENEDLESNSLYHLLQEKYGLRIGSVKRTIEAVQVSNSDANLLGVEPKSAIHLVKTTGFLDDGRPFEYSIARYRGDLSSFTVTLKYQFGGFGSK